MTLEKAQLDRLSRELMAAESSLIPMEPITDMFPDVSIAEAYAIQLRTIETKVKNGAVIVGKKIGLTSKAMQEMFGVRQPDYGHILDHAVILEGQPISL